MAAGQQLEMQQLLFSASALAAQQQLLVQRQQVAAEAAAAPAVGESFWEHEYALSPRSSSSSSSCSSFLEGGEGCEGSSPGRSRKRRAASGPAGPRAARAFKGSASSFEVLNASGAAHPAQRLELAQQLATAWSLAAAAGPVPEPGQAPELLPRRLALRLARSLAGIRPVLATAAPGDDGSECIHHYQYSLPAPPGSRLHGKRLHVWVEEVVEGGCDACPQQAAPPTAGATCAAAGPACSTAAAPTAHMGAPAAAAPV